MTGCGEMEERRRKKEVGKRKKDAMMLRFKVLADGRRDNHFSMEKHANRIGTCKVTRKSLKYLTLR